MKKIIILATALILGSATVVSAQDFLTINPDVRTAGMADASVATSGEEFAIFNNAAASLFDYNRFRVGFSYTPWQADVKSGYNMYSLGGFFSINQKHSIAFGARVYNEPKLTPTNVGGTDYPFNPTDENGNPIEGFKSFRPLSFSADLAYSLMIGDYVGLSLTGKYIESKYGDLATNSAVGFDIAAYSQIPLDVLLDGAWISIGAKVADVGFALGKGVYNLPMRANVGAALYAPLTDAHTIQGTVDLGYRFTPAVNRSFGLAIGAEYTAMDLISVRAGYYVADNNGYNYTTVGVGIRFMHIKVDASYLVADKECPWRNTYRVGIGLYF